MLIPEFQVQIDRLISRYGQRYYPPERIKTLWSRIEHRSIHTLTKAVDYLIGNNQTDPDNKKIFEAIQNAERQLNKASSPPEDVARIHCFDCLDMGLMFVTSDDGIATWVYCHCEEGSHQVIRRNLNLPKWGKDLSMVCNRRPLPISFFKPREALHPEAALMSLEKIALEFNKELRAAEMYWRTKDV